MTSLSSHQPVIPSASTSYADQVAATTFKRLHPSSYLRRFLDAAVREDARHLHQPRPVTISLGSISTAHGSCFVKLQNTVCIAAVKAEIAAPQLARPDEGYLVPNVELPALASTRFKPGPPGDEAQVVTDRLLTFLNTSSLLDRTTLNIETGAAVWSLYLDIAFISYDGNALDAAVLAAVGALRNVSLPKAVYHAETKETRQDPSGERSKLAIRGTPLCASFGVFEGTYLLSDPSAFESSLLTTHATIGFHSAPSPSSQPAELCYLWQSGSLRTAHPNQPNATTDRQNLDLCIQLAKKRCAELSASLLDAEAC
ncbi:hypothetical protein ACQY0O_004787 [Thecaphora frezii]